MMVFLWFAVCAIPAGMLMGRIGRRNTVLVSMGITAVAMLIPMCGYEFVPLLIAFALLGIGNTLLQVSLNPMVAGIVRGDRLASVLTMGQFIKAVSSFLGPIIAGAAAAYLGSWKMIFIVFMVVTLLSMAWLLLTVPADRSEEEVTTFRSAFHLFPTVRYGCSSWVSWRWSVLMWLEYSHSQAADGADGDIPGRGRTGNQSVFRCPYDRCVHRGIPAGENLGQDFYEGLYDSSGSGLCGTALRDTALVAFRPDSGGQPGLFECLFDFVLLRLAAFFQAGQ